MDFDYMLRLKALLMADSSTLMRSRITGEKGSQVPLNAAKSYLDELNQDGMPFAEKMRLMPYNPNVFAEGSFVDNFTGMELWRNRDYQLCWLEDFQKYQIVAIQASRQSGLSKTLCMYVLWHALAHKNQRIAVISRNYGSSVSRKQEYAKLFQYNVFTSGTNIKQTRETIYLENGSEIQFVDTNSLIRGLSLDLIVVDDADFIRDDYIVRFWDSVFAASYRIIVGTTGMRGENSFFKSFRKRMNPHYICTNYEYQQPFSTVDFDKERASLGEAIFNNQHGLDETKSLHE